MNVFICLFLEGCYDSHRWPNSSIFLSNSQCSSTARHNSRIYALFHFMPISSITIVLLHYLISAHWIFHLCLLCCICWIVFDHLLLIYPLLSPWAFELEVTMLWNHFPIFIFYGTAVLKCKRSPQRKIDYIHHRKKHDPKA